MKICQICPYTAPAKDSMGAERMIEALTRGLQEMGHEVVMLLNQDSTDTPAPLVSEIPGDCDIVHYHGWPLPHTPPKPYVITMHGGGNDNHAKNEGWYANPHMIAVSEFVAKRSGLEAFVWAGSHLDDFIYDTEKEDYFLWMAGTDWGEGKGLWTTIQLAHKMGFKLKIAGSGKNTSTIAQIKELCNDKIEYLGSVNGEEKAKLLSKARALFLLTNLPDACPLTVSEAYLSGTPVIASDKGAMPEIVTWATGYVCKGIPDIAKAIHDCKTPDLLKYENCRTRGEHLFSQEAMAEKYFTYYNKMLQLGTLL